MKSTDIRSAPLDTVRVVRRVVDDVCTLDDVMGEPSRQAAGV